MREPSQHSSTSALQVIVMSGHETIRVLEVEVDAPPCQEGKASALQGEAETMDRPLPSSEDPQVADPSWRTVVLPDRQWNGWREADAPAQSSAAGGKGEGDAREAPARPAEQPAAGGAPAGAPVSHSAGVEGSSLLSSFSGHHPSR